MWEHQERKLGDRRRSDTVGPCVVQNSVDLWSALLVCASDSDMYEDGFAGDDAPYTVWPSIDDNPEMSGIMVPKASNVRDVFGREWMRVFLVSIDLSYKAAAQGRDLSTSVPRPNRCCKRSSTTFLQTYNVGLMRPFKVDVIVMMRNELTDTLHRIWQSFPRCLGATWGIQENWILMRRSEREDISSWQETRSTDFLYLS